MKTMRESPMISTRHRRTLRSLNLWVGVWHCILAVVICITVASVGSPFQLNLTQLYSVVDTANLPAAALTPLCTDSVTNRTRNYDNVFEYLRCIAPVTIPTTLKVSSVGSVPVWVLLLIFEVVTAASHFRLVWFDHHYHQLLNLRLNPARWREYAVTNTLMLVSILALTGISELYLVLLITFSAVVMNYCGGFVHEVLVAVEKELGSDAPLVDLVREAKWVVFVLAWVAFVIPLVYLFQTFDATTASYFALPTGSLWRQLFAIIGALNVGITVCYSAFPALHLIQTFTGVPYIAVEIGFVVASLVAKSFLTMIVMAATVQRS